MGTSPVREFVANALLGVKNGSWKKDPKSCRGDRRKSFC
jgi:hypothetical protein